jgi:hypothetical protein
MTKRRKALSNIAIAKNTVRGAIGNESTLFKSIAATIETIPEGQIHSFARWVAQYPSKKARIFPPLKITNYSGLKPRAFLKVADLKKQLRWTTEFIVQHLALLDIYLAHLARYELAFMSGDYAAAKASLEGIEQSTGLSLWLVESYIAVLQRLEGLESQKAYALSIHEALPNSITAFLAHYLSQRNEDAVSFGRFSPRIESHIESQPIPDEVKAFMRNRLVGRLLTPFDEKEVCYSLSVSSVFSLVDAYESLIESLQEVLKRPPTDSQLTTIRLCLAQLQCSDWRIYKMRALVNVDFSLLPLRSSSADDLLLRGRLQDSRAAGTKCITDNANDIDSMVVVANSISKLEEPAADIPEIPNQIVTVLSSLRARRGVSKAADDLSKLILNLRTVRTANALAGFLALDVLDYPQSRESQGTAIFLSSPYLNPRHWFILPDSAAEGLLASCVALDDRSLTLNLCMTQLHRLPLDDDSIPSEELSALAAAAAFYHGDYDAALSCAESLSRSPSLVWQQHAITLELYCLIATDRFDLAIRRAAALCSESDELRHVLPLRSLLGGKRWRDVKTFAADIALPITFDLYVRTVGETEHETNRRIAYDEFLRAHNVRRPSDLAFIVERFPRKELVYLLYNVCIPHVMDVSFDTYKSSREIEEERIRVCSLLTELDPINSSVYTEEVKNRTKYITIQDGLRDVDRSRVYVNTEAVARWAEREAKESFFRYKELLRVRVGFGSPEDIDLALRKIAEGAPPRDFFLQYPEQEGDSLLFDMFETIKKEYLSNTDYGLDAYLSMRIRHGSLSGYMRGPLEERSLIVAKDEAAARYADNLALIESLGVTSETDKRTINEAFRSFSERYDGIIDSLTKDRLQIRGPRNL